MTARLPGDETSLWLATTAKTDYPPLPANGGVFDVAIVGGGISGILTAWMCQKEGLKTVLVEKDRIIANTTGNTTAKLTSQHNLVYHYLLAKHGRQVAKAFGQANQQAIEDIDAVAQSLGIDCDFERADAHAYTQQSKGLQAIKDEVKAAKSLGLPASFVTNTDLPFAVKGAVKFTGQAQFHPRKFLLGVAADYMAAGGIIFEQTEALDIKTGRPNTLKTKQGELKAGSIVVASKYPFWRREIFDKATWVKLSYALGVTLREDLYPRGMYISTEAPVRTIRSHPYKKSRILIFGGESHKLTKGYDKSEHYKNLVTDVGQKFPVDKIIYRWVAGDMMPRDHLPYIGLYPKQSSVYVITGFHAWGLTWGMVAAGMIRDQINGRANPLRELFSPKRLEA
jgi:glycine/D-amino acid oxidase-like deaminating enzyme